MDRIRGELEKKGGRWRGEEGEYGRLERRRKIIGWRRGDYGV